MPFPLIEAGIAAGAGGLTGLLSNLFGPDKKEWTDADLAKWGWKDFNAGEANELLMSNAANLINTRRSNANAKASQLGLDPVKSSYSMQGDIMQNVFNQATDIYGKSIESKQNKARMLGALNMSEPEETGMFDDIFSGAGLGLNIFSKFYDPKGAKDGAIIGNPTPSPPQRGGGVSLMHGGIMPNDSTVPKNKDVYPTMLAKNEGVLNAEAMQIPGIKEFVKHMNKVGLSLRETSPHKKKDEMNSQHMQAGGIAGDDDNEFKSFPDIKKKRGSIKSINKNKKLRKVRTGKSLEEEVQDINFNPGDIMKEVGYNAFNELSHNLPNQLMPGDTPGDLNPGVMKLAKINDMLSDKYGFYFLPEGGIHRVESGMNYNPLTGLKLSVGEEPVNKSQASGMIRGNKYMDAENKIVPPLFNMHSHDFNEEPSPQDMLMSSKYNNSLISSILEDGGIGLTKYNEFGEPIVWNNKGKFKSSTKLGRPVLSY